MTTSSLRYRIAVAFALFGGVVSLVLASGLYIAFRNLEAQLIDDTLTAELQDYIERRGRNPQSRPETTATIRAYVIESRNPMPVPPAVKALAPGRHELLLEGVRYRAAVEDVDSRRFVILYNESQAARRERSFLALLAVGALGMALLSALAGYWLAGRVIAPVTDLVRRVAGLRPEDQPARLADEYPWDEVKELARDFDDYLLRLRAFIERERAFTGDVSHELRTPLTVINGATELLLATDRLDEKDREKARRIARAAAEMKAITEALLVLAREQESGGDLMDGPCDVDVVLGEEFERTRELYRHKAITGGLEIKGHPRVVVDRAVLGMVVGNLLRNSFAYTERGTVQVTLDDSGVTIIDTGSGMDADEVERAFHRHYRGETAGAPGAGIGLSLVRRICDRYRWHIDLESEPEKGTRVRLSFTS